MILFDDLIFFNGWGKFSGDMGVHFALFLLQFNLCGKERVRINHKQKCNFRRICLFLHGLALLKKYHKMIP